jgi:hypothetical protein
MVVFVNFILQLNILQVQLDQVEDVAVDGSQSADEEEGDGNQADDQEAAVDQELGEKLLHMADENSILRDRVQELEAEKNSECQGCIFEEKEDLNENLDSDSDEKLHHDKSGEHLRRWGGLERELGFRFG